MVKQPFELPQRMEKRHNTGREFDMEKIQQKIIYLQKSKRVQGIKKILESCSIFLLQQN